MSQSKLRPNLVVFTACRSSTTDYAPALGVAQSMLYAGIPSVVGMQANVYLREARAFTGAFYRALVERATIDDAMLAARRSLAANQSVSLREGTERVLERMLDSGYVTSRLLNRWLNKHQLKDLYLSQLGLCRCSSCRAAVGLGKSHRSVRLRGRMGKSWST